ncbi:MAG: GYD domain-containing protein [Acetobacteraceae bacterium]|nr:GYD domain-containing protein [Acetobacteraceae bacterium]MSP28912.1 GYD domain-containing protein [Acetobacteraceae bacterium]
MPSCVLLAHRTDQGVRTIGDLSKRLESAKKVLIKMGSQFNQILMITGEYDLVAIYEVSGDAVAARFTLMLGKTGSIRTTSLKALPEETFR